MSGKIRQMDHYQMTLCSIAITTETVLILCTVFKQYMKYNIHYTQSHRNFIVEWLDDLHFFQLLLCF